MNEIKNILIVRTDRIGDVVLSLPLASIIKKHIPNSKVTFLVREYTAPLVLNNKFVDEVIILEEQKGKVQLAKNIAMLKGKFDACIVAFPTFTIASILFLCGIRTRIGSGYRWYSFLFNKKVFEHRKYGERHELEYNVRLLHQLNIYEEASPNNAEFGITIDKETNQQVLQKLFSLGYKNEKKIIILHPGSGGSAIDLPKEKMKLLAQKISDELDAVLIITGNKAEEELCKTFVVSNKVINTNGIFDLKELTALISNAKILIANSTGPIHIASALGKSVIGFYPKFAAVSPKRWGPYSNKAVLFQPKSCDGNCSRAKCEQTNCMNSIDVSEVFDTIKKIFSED